MNNLELRDPIAVWQAAIGNTEPLEKRLRSHEKLTVQELDALALLVGSKLKPPKRKKKIKVLSFNDMIALTPKQKVRNGVSLYKHIMSELKKMARVMVVPMKLLNTLRRKKASLRTH